MYKTGGSFSILEVTKTQNVKLSFSSLSLAFLIILFGCNNNAPQETIDNLSYTSPQYSSWYAYGGNTYGNRYSESEEISKNNVADLEVAWTYNTGELGQNSAITEKLTFESTPVIFGGHLLLSTAYGKVIALNPETGEEQWVFDPEVNRQIKFSELTSRGVSVWIDSSGKSTDECAESVFIGTVDSRLIKLDVKTGKPCASFGKNGTVNLSKGLNNKSESDYQVTSPPTIINDLVVVGSSIGDNWHADTGSGVVRAYSAKTGALRWSWDPLAASRDQFTGPVGAANAWSVLSADPDMGLVYVPTSSPSPDFYGGFRPGDNKYANSVVALHAETGKVKWHFQTVHHDLWDYDLAAQPILVELTRDGKTIPALVQATKMGSLFVFNRETGEPIFPIEERPVPASTIPGEYTSPTQPFSSLPSLMPTGPLTKDHVWGLTKEEQAENLAYFEQYRNEGIFTPPSLEGTIMYPGNGSGVNWGSVAFDPDRNFVIANTCRYATLVQLIERDSFEETSAEGGNYEYSKQRKSPYGSRRTTLVSSAGNLRNPPPWGVLTAMDLSKGEKAWEVNIGNASGLNVGLPNFGGPIVTKGGLIFLGATTDNAFRAFDIDTGKVLWETSLPRCAIATPMTYTAPSGKQFVVTAAGGHGKAGLEIGDFVYAFALPD